MHQRELLPYENALLRSANSDGWDEGKIAQFVGSSGVALTAWSVKDHKVLLYAPVVMPKREMEEIVATCGMLWDWLGVPRPFTLILWWRDDPRQLAAGEWPSKATVNGGWTNQNSSVIHVYRSEEWDRVFLHEMIHALGWDWKMPETPLVCWGLPRDSYIVPALFEAWTELYAEWLWCLWRNVPWEQQRAWQDYQATQILARYHMLEMETWRENTSVFAYYVLKAALAPHIAELLLFGNGTTPQERESVLCRLGRPGLDALVQEAMHVTPEDISLCMSARL